MREAMGLRSDLLGLTAFQALVAARWAVECLARCRPSDEALVYAVCRFGEYVQSKRRRGRATNVITPLLGGYRVDQLPRLLSELEERGRGVCYDATGYEPEDCVLVMVPV